MSLVDHHVAHGVHGIGHLGHMFSKNVGQMRHRLHRETHDGQFIGDILASTLEILLLSRITETFPHRLKVSLQTIKHLQSTLFHFLKLLNRHSGSTDIGVQITTVVLNFFSGHVGETVDHVVDRFGFFTNLLSQDQQLLNGERRHQHHLYQTGAVLFDTLGDFNFAFTG